MSLYTKIGDTFFPVDTAKPNQLSSYYESYVLIPNLCPLLYSKLYGKLIHVVSDFISAIKLVDDIRFYRTKYKKIPPTPFIPDYIAASDTSINKGKRRPVFNIDDAYNRPNKRKPQTVLHSLNSIGRRIINTAPVTNTSFAINKQMNNYKNILSDLSKKNVTIKSLVKNNLMLGEEGIASKKLLSVNKRNQIELMVGCFVSTEGSAEPSRNMSAYSKSLTNMLLKKNKMLLKFNTQISEIIFISMSTFFKEYDCSFKRSHQGN